MEKVIKAYKLVRKLKDGSLSSLFINKRERFTFNEWLEAEDHPTKGFAHRPGWHCTFYPEAPHLEKHSTEVRVWVEVELKDFEIHKRPDNQGGWWLLAKHMKVCKELTPHEVFQINKRKEKAYEWFNSLFEEQKIKIFGEDFENKTPKEIEEAWESRFYVISYSKSKEKYSLWWEKLSVLVYKNGTSIWLEEEEIQELVNKLPRTFGGNHK